MRKLTAQMTADREEPRGGAVRRQHVGRLPVPVGEPAVAPGLRRSQAHVDARQRRLGLHRPEHRPRVRVHRVWRMASPFSTSPTRGARASRRRDRQRPRRGATSRSTSCSTQPRSAGAPYAYVTADNVPDPLMVLDLSGLPNGVEQRQLHLRLPRGAQRIHRRTPTTLSAWRRPTQPVLLGICRRQSQRRQPSALLARQSARAGAAERLDRGLRARPRVVPGQEMRARTASASTRQRSRYARC